MLLTPKLQAQSLMSLVLFFKLDLSVTNFLIINSLTLVFFIGVVYSTNIKKTTKNQTAFFLIPNSWQVFVEIIYDVPSQLPFDNVNVEGEKYFPYISMIFVFIIFNNPPGVLSSSFPKRLIALDTPSFWQTGFGDPANFWLASEHIHFFLCSSVILSIWLVVCFVHFFIEINKPRSNKSVLSKEFTKVCWVWVTAFIIAVSLIFHVELWGIPITSLEQGSALPEPEVGKAVNPLWGPPEAANREMLEEVWWVIKEMDSRGYSKDRILAILYSETPDDFWSLGYDLKVRWVQRYLDEQELSRKVYAVVGIAVLVVVMLWLNP